MSRGATLESHSKTSRPDGALCVFAPTPASQPLGKTSGDQEGNPDTLPLPSLLSDASAELLVDLGVKVPY